MYSSIKTWSDLEKVTTVAKVRALLIQDEKNKAYRVKRNADNASILAKAKAQGITAD